MDTNEQNQNAPQDTQNATRRVEMFLEVLEHASIEFGVKLGISDTITKLPNGGFIYTPPAIIPILASDWTPCEKKAESLSLQ